MGDRTVVVGLSNSFGSVAGGRDKHAIARTLDNYDAMGNVYGSSVTTIHAAQGSRVSNALFLSATPVTGLTVTYINSNSKTAGVINAQSGSIEYVRGPVAATVARYDSGTNSASNIFGARYSVAQTGTTLFGLYSDDTVSGVSSTGKTVGISQPLNGALTALASYGEKDSVKAFDLGATYALSKRTFVNARYVCEDLTATTKYALGLEHNF